MELEPFVKEKPTIAENTTAIVLSATLLIFQDASLGFVVMLFTLLIAFYFTHETKWRKRIEIFGFIFLITFVILFIADSILTYRYVLIDKIAIEYGILPNFLWNHFGIVGGELIRIAIFSAIWVVTFYNFISKDVKRKITAFITLIFCNLAYILVVSSNIIQAIGYQ